MLCCARSATSSRSPVKTLLSPNGLDVPPMRRIEPLVEVDVNLHVHVFEARVALAMDVRVDGALHREHSIGLADLELDPNRVGKDEPLERLDRHLVGHQHDLPAAGEEPADVDLVRTIHKPMPPQHETPPTRRGRHGLCPF